MINVKKDFKTKFLLGLSSICLVAAMGVHPTFAEGEQKAELDLPFRYLNQKCEFSYKLPEAPRSEAIWGENELPIKMINNPGFGEVAEKVSYKKSSFDGKDFFHFEAYCFFLDKEAMKDSNIRHIKSELERVETDEKLKSANIKIQELGRGLLAGTLSGFVVDSKSEAVTSHRRELYRGEQSLLYIKASYSADNINNTDLFQAVQESFLFEPLKN